MPRQISKAEAQAYHARWKAANAAEREELRATPIETKLRQLAAMMASVKSFGWDESLQAEEIEVRKRWGRLRRNLHV